MASPRLLPAMFSVLAFLTGATTAAGQEAAAKSVAITFDDLPFARPSTTTAAEAVRTDAAIRRVLVQERVPAIGFVTEANVRAFGAHGPRMLRGWLQDGLELGNHGATHADANTLQLGEIRREIADGEATAGPLARAFGRPLRFYRFAYNHVGDTPAKRIGIEQLLAERGYRPAASTIDTSDYLFEAAYHNARSDAALQRRIKEAYLDHSRAQIRFYGALNKQVLGREPPAIIVLHSNRLNAATLDRLLAVFREEGYRFVTLEAAQSDAAYQTPPAFTTRHGPMWGYRWARERRVRPEGIREQEPPAWIKTLAETGKLPPT